MFYLFVQNNTHGYYSGPMYVIVEADNAEEANELVLFEGSPVYFDGCKAGRDCECCGDRWYRVYYDGDETPSIYGEPIKKSDDVLLVRKKKLGMISGVTSYWDLEG